jgi:ABC-type nitrate/sulfonate/bicarbonate transport system substrate-binding protein
VLCATDQTLRRDPGLAQKVVDTLAHGYQFTLTNPKRAALDLEQQVPGLEPKLVSQQLTALLPAFQGPGGHVGALDMSTLRSWARWEARFGIVSRPPDASRAFDPSFAADVPPAPSG